MKRPRRPARWLLKRSSHLFLATVDGPLTNDTLAYIYDELGRPTTRAINGAANSVTWAFEALGRATSEANVLGSFTYTYDGVTPRLATVAYPNGQTSAYSSLPNSGDHRLQTIHHQYPSTATLSKFDYTSWRPTRAGTNGPSNSRSVRLALRGRSRTTRMGP